MTNDEWFVAQKKPVEIQARGPYYDPCAMETLEGDFAIDQEYVEEHNGYYIIRGVNGTEYPFAADIFDDRIEEVTNDG